jgi:hypothetical protein
MIVKLTRLKYVRSCLFVFLLNSREVRPAAEWEERRKIFSWRAEKWILRWSICRSGVTLCQIVGFDVSCLELVSLVRQSIIKWIRQLSKTTDVRCYVIPVVNAQSISVISGLAKQVTRCACARIKCLPLITIMACNRKMYLFRSLQQYVCNVLVF